MELRNERLFDLRERNARRWLVPVLIGVVVVGFPSVWFGPLALTRFHEARLLRNGKNATEADPVRAAICFRRVLGINGGNVDAMRGLAAIAEKYAPEEGVVLRERVTQLVPDSYDDARAWGMSALRLGQDGRAEEAFALMSKSNVKSAEHFLFGGDVALAGGRLQEARSRYAKAAEAGGGSDRARLQIATIDVVSGEPVEKQRAREALRALRQDPVHRHAATRALIADLLQRAEVAEALSLAREFILDPDATFQDRLQYLGILRSIEEPSGSFVSSFQGASALSLGLTTPKPQDTFASVLSDLQERAKGDPGKVAALITFLNSRGLSLVACEWVSTLPKAEITVPPVAPALAEAYRLSLDWGRLSELLTDANWGTVEFLRAAFVAYAKREEGDRAASANEWANALRLVDYRPEKLAALEQMTSSWGWVEEWTEVVWTIARTSKRPREALEALANFYREKRDTQKAFVVWSRLLDSSPGDLTIRKNWALLSLLLNNDTFRTATMIEGLRKEGASDPEIACLYALLLHRRERYNDAVSTLEGLTLEQRRAPRVAAYYGQALFAVGRKSEAADYIARARDARLFREEQDFVDKVRRNLN